MPRIRLQFLVFCGALFLFVYSASAFIGPTNNPGVGGGALYVDANGNLGIGTTNPGGSLHIKASSTGIGIALERNSYGADTIIQFKNENASNKAKILFSGDDERLALYSTNGTQALVITSTGSVGVGTTTPASTFSVIGSTRTSSGFYGNGANITSIDPANTIGGPFSSANYAFPLSLGVGTSTTALLPQALSVYGGGYFSGNVGIGKIASGNTLDVAGSINSGMVGVNGSLYLNSAADGAGGASLVYSNVNNVLTIGQNRGIASKILLSSNNGIEFQTEDTSPPYNKVTRMIIKHGDTGNIGIGTSTPSYKLSVQGPIYSTGSSTASAFCLAGTCQTSWSALGGQWTTTSTGIFYNSGNVGVGTAAPSQKLEVSGGSSASTINANVSAANYNFGLYRWTGVAGTYRSWHLVSNGNNGQDLDFQYGGDAAIGSESLSPKVTFMSSGNVGIGTTTPNAKLDLNGTSLISGGAAWSLGAISGVGATAKGIYTGYDTSNDVGWIKSLENNTAFKPLRIGANNLSFWTHGGSLVQRMTILENGNVGIATTTPSYGLTVVGTGSFSQPIYVGTPTVAGHATTKSYVDSMFTGSGQWTTNGSSVYLTSTTQNVGIGTANPAVKLDVNGDVYASGTISIRNVASDRKMQFLRTGGNTFSIEHDAQGIYFYNVTTAQALTRWLNTGNVGIGTASPTSIGTGYTTLDIIGSSGGGIAFGTTTARSYVYGGSDLYLQTSNSTLFYNNGSEKMRIRTDGNVGIATTTPGYGLTVVGTGSFSQPVYVGTPTAAGHAVTKNYVDTNFMASTSVSSQWTTTSTGIFYNSGSVGIGTATPGAKLVVKTGAESGNGIRLIDSSWGDNEFNGFGIYGAGDTEERASFGWNYNPTYVAIKEAGSAVIVIKSGNVGIATTTPAYTLSVNGTIGSNGNTITVNSGNYIGTSGGRFSKVLVDAGAWMQSGGATGSDDIGFYVNSAEKVTIDNTGNVGIATTTPGYRLTVVGTGSFSQPVYVGTPTAAGHAVTKSYVDTNFMASTSISSQWTTTSTGIFYNGGNVGIGTAVPSQKLEISSVAHEGLKLTGNTGGSSGYVGAILEIESNTDYRGRGIYLSHRDATDLSASEWYIGTPYEGNMLQIGNAPQSVGINSASSSAVKSQAKFVITEDGKVGIGTSTPSSKIHIYDGNNSIRIGDILGNSTAAIELNDSGAVQIQGYGDALKFRTGSNDRITILSSGYIGVATTTPTYNLHVVGTGSFSQPIYVGTPTAAGHAVTKSYVDDLFTNPTFTGVASFSSITVSGTSSFTGAASFGDILVSGNLLGSLNMNGNNITGVNKLTVSTIDPVYDIGGQKYATYVSDSIGIKVVASGKGSISINSAYVIDFKKAVKGSDEWLFWQTIKEGENMADVTVLLTPEGTNATLWYELKPNVGQVLIHSSKKTKFSYQLSAPRHDANEWGNTTNTEEKGIILPLR